jgi:hypothetical protein
MPTEHEDEEHLSYFVSDVSESGEAGLLVGRYATLQEAIVSAKSDLTRRRAILVQPKKEF